VLTCYAALPWLLRLFVRVGQRPVGVQKTQVWALAVLFGAVVAAFAPIFVIVALFASAAWMTADLVSRVRWQAIVAVLQLMFVLVVGIIVLNFPWSGGFIASDWWQQLVGVQTLRGGHVGLATLARMDSGVIAISILALGLYVPVIIGLLIVRGVGCAFCVARTLFTHRCGTVGCRLCGCSDARKRDFVRWGCMRSVIGGSHNGEFYF
jgi:hypothetical protein